MLRQLFRLVFLFSYLRVAGLEATFDLSLLLELLAVDESEYALKERAKLRTYLLENLP